MLQQEFERGQDDSEAYENTHKDSAQNSSPSEPVEAGLAPMYPLDMQQQVRRGSYTLRPLLDGIRGIMDKVLTDAPVPQPNIDPGQQATGSCVSQALTELDNTNVPGPKPRRQSLAAANRYSNVSCDDDQCNDTQAGSPAQSSMAVPASLPEGKPSGTHTAEGRMFSQMDKGATRHEPLKWQMPESSRHLWEQRLGTNAGDATKSCYPQSVSAAQVPQQLSWTAKGAGSPQTLKARRGVAGKQPAAAAGKSRGPKVSGTIARQQENDSKSAAVNQPDAEAAERSRSRAADNISSAADESRESLAEAVSHPKRCALPASPDVIKCRNCLSCCS